MANEGVFVKFDPEKILEVSQTLEDLHKRFLQVTDSMKRKSDSLINVWQSDSATLYAEKLEEIYAQSDVLAGRISSLSRDLGQASGIYRKGEADSVKEAQGLPTEGVFLT